MQLIGIGTELAGGTVISIQRRTVTVEREGGVRVQLTLKEAEDAVRSVSEA
jgi:hypothetical protein